MKMMKRKIALVLCIVMGCSLMLSACSDAGSGTADATTTAADADATEAPDDESEDDASSATDSTGEAVEIRATWWGDTGRHELYNSIIDEFEKVHTNVTVVREPGTWVDYWDKLSVQTAGGNAPDFIGMHPQFASDYIGRGLVAPLDSYIEDGTIDLSGWQEGVVNTGVIGGVNYMVPMGITYSVTFVNEGLFNELGITVPSVDWTWEDVKTIGIEAREKLDAAGMNNSWLVNDATSTLQYWRYYLRQLGKEIYTEDGEINFLPEDVESYFVMFNEFRELGIIPDAATSTEYANATLEDSLFSRDMVMVYSVPVNQYKLYSTTFPDKELSIVRNPVAEGKSVGEYPEGAHFAVFAGSPDDKKLGAAQLLNFWVNTPEALSLFGLDQGVPGNETLKDAYTDGLDEYQLEILSFAEDLSKIATPSTYPPVGASEVDALFKSLGEQVSFGMLEPADAAQQFYDEAVEIVAKSKT